MKLINISQIYKNPDLYFEKEIKIGGFIKTNRDLKSFGFISLTDGTYFEPIQIVYDNTLENFDTITHLNVATSLIITGILKETKDAKQPFEIKANKIEIEGYSDNTYPLQKKRHTLEFLRTIPHLRPRTNTFQAVFKIRSLAAQAIHKFFAEKNFVYVHTPIITASDCEGAGEMFRVTTLDLNSNSKLNDTDDFFNKPVYLTVSGQLDVEAYAMAFKNVYTFGPTFRAENSNTTRHAAEFWMIEPEIVFADLNDNMDLAEEFLKYIIKNILDNAKPELQFLDSFIEKGLIQRLESIYNSEFLRKTYTECVDILLEHNDKFDKKVSWGDDLQTEHERYLTEQIFKQPVFVTNYPKEIKAFYMKENEDKKTVAAVDLLVPGIGEIIGGSQREDNMEKLLQRMEEVGLNQDDYKAYIDLRKYGSVRHSGFGLGFERLIMYLTGIANIRDVIPYPRTPGNFEQ